MNQLCFNTQSQKVCLTVQDLSQQDIISTQLSLQDIGRGLSQAGRAIQPYLIPLGVGAAGTAAAILAARNISNQRQQPIIQYGTDFDVAPY